MKATPAWSPLHSYNVQNPSSSLPIDFNTKSRYQSILGGLVVGKHKFKSESQTDSTLLKIFEWPLLPTSKASHFIWVSVTICSALAMLHSLSWCPVLCTFYSWVFHKLLALLTLCLMNLWDPMSARLFLDIRRCSIWSTGKGPRLTIAAWSTPWEWQVLARSTGSEVSHCLWSHRSQGQGRQWGGSYRSCVRCMASHFA